MTRDDQRHKVYAAENILARLYTNTVSAQNPVVTINGVTVTLPPEAKFGSVESIQAYVDRVMAMPAVQEAHPVRSQLPVRVRARRGAKAAHCDRALREIAIPDKRDGVWAMRELVVLHELAHHLAPRGGHGPHFVDTLLTLFTLVLGPETGLIARMIFADGGVNASAAPSFV